MLPRRTALLAVIVIGLGWWLGSATPAHSQQMPTPPLPNFYYYPYYYFPWNYWPNNSPQWPEKPGMPSLPPPAYMSYPAFREPGWHYDLWSPMPYYRGFHYWLDAF